MKQKLVRLIGLGVLLTLCFQVTLFAEGGSLETSISESELICDCGLTWEEHLNTLNLNSKARICTCGGRLIEQKVSSTGPYYTGDSRKCTHEPYGHDYEQETQHTYSISCSDCSFETYSNKSTYSWVCKGF